MPETTRALQENENWIPSISDERLHELFKQIKPVVRMKRVLSTNKKHGDDIVTVTTRPNPNAKWKWIPSKDGSLYYIKYVDPRLAAFTWNPKPVTKARNIKPLCNITTYHTYGYYGFFKPSIAEVLAQIPDEHLDKVIAFEIVDKPESADDLNRERKALYTGYHVATTRLYIQG